VSRSLEPLPPYILLSLVRPFLRAKNKKEKKEKKEKREKKERR
jgi:hypothetical protein